MNRKYTTYKKHVHNQKAYNNGYSLGKNLALQQNYKAPNHRMLNPYSAFFNLNRYISFNAGLRDGWSDGLRAKENAKTYDHFREVRKIREQELKDSRSKKTTKELER